MSSEDNNLLNRLRQKRQRSEVPEREDNLIQPSQQPEKLEEEQSRETDNTLADLKSQLAKYPETKRHSAIVLEKEISIELTQYCKSQGITVETYLEAAWAIANTDPVLLERITTEGAKRYKSRKEAGKIRRLITMLSKSNLGSN